MYNPIYTFRSRRNVDDSEHLGHLYPNSESNISALLDNEYRENYSE